MARGDAVPAVTRPLAQLLHGHRRRALMLPAIGLERVVARARSPNGAASLPSPTGCLVAMYVAPCEARRLDRAPRAHAAPGAHAGAVDRGAAAARARRVFAVGGAPLLGRRLPLSPAQSPRTRASSPRLWLMMRKSSLLLMAVPAALALIWRRSWDASFSRERLRRASAPSSSSSRSRRSRRRWCSSS